MPKRPSQFLQGSLPLQALKNPQKYQGRNQAVEFKSSYELAFIKYLDMMNTVINWNYEETPITYKSPLDNREHRYWIDFYMKYYSADQKIKEALVEIKPFYEAQWAMTGRVEFKTKVSDKEKIEIAQTAIINNLKWKAAMEFCRRNNLKFVVLTEKDLVLSGLKNFGKV